VQSEELKTDIFNKIDRAKLMIGEKVSTVTNAQVLNEVLNFFLKYNAQDHTSSSACEVVPETEHFLPYPLSSSDQSDEPIFITTELSIRNLSAGIQCHSRQCNEFLDVKSIEQFGHVTPLRTWSFIQDRHIIPFARWEIRGQLSNYAWDLHIGTALHTV